MLAVHCDKCGKVLLLGDDHSLNKQMNEAGWCKLYMSGTGTSELDLCKECSDDLKASVRKEVDI